MPSNLRRIHWNRWVASHPHAQFLQSWEWGEFQKSLGREIVRIAKSDAAILTDCAFAFHLPLWRGASYLYCPRGPLAHVDWCLEELKQATSEFLFIRYEPPPVSEPLQAQGIKTLSIQPEIEWVLDLSQGYDQIQKALHQKTRYNIRLANKKGVQVRTVDNREQLKREDIMTFFTLLSETARVHGFRLHPEGYYRSFIEFFLPNDKSTDVNTPFIHLSFAEYNTRSISSIMIMYFGDTALYVHGGSARSYREHRGSYLLHDHAIKDASMRGYRYYNFGGIAPDGSPRHPLSGVTRFKRGFGGEPQRYPGTYDYPLQKIPYMLYTTGRTVLRALSSFNG